MADQPTPNQLGSIPQPPGKFILGNLPDVMGDVPILDLMELAREYGPIYQLTFPGRPPLTVVSGFQLVNELCDDSRFDKAIGNVIEIARETVGDGLFTAYTQEPNWRKAHSILLPYFSLRAMQDYFPKMLDIAGQLADKWERLNPDEEIDVTADMTRLTLDTIGLCGFDYRFNSFYRDTLHPFVQAMMDNLEENQERQRRLPIQDRLMIRKQRQREANREIMYDLIDHMIQDREAMGEHAADKKDLLGFMLTGVDKESGERLDDTNIRYQCLTFLFAGHETTSGLLSFALYFLLKHPVVTAKAYAEVDRVLGTDTTILPTYNQVHQLQYLTQILKESLRLWPTAPGFSRHCYTDETVIGGKYTITKDQQLTVLTPMLHRDPGIWGADAEHFNPDHFQPEKELALPANAFKPFGTGQRACIGRTFAMQEATLVLGMILQRFQLIDSQHYKLKIQERATIKPADFKIQVRKRTDVVQRAPEVAATPLVETTTVPAQAVTAHHTPLLVLYGSNLGTSEDLAEQIAADGKLWGFTSAAAPLDDYVQQLPKEGAVVIVTASYNGTPPDNAEAFCRWLTEPSLATDAFNGVKYTVFGCGNHEWAATFQAIPRLVDHSLEQHSATRIYPRGEGDAAGDFDSAFQAWYQPLWHTLAEVFSLDLGAQAQAASAPSQLYEVEVLSGSEVLDPFVASVGARRMKVVAMRELHRKDGPHPSPRSTRDIELALPAGMRYQTGDHLGVLARNCDAQVKRVAQHFHFDKESQVRLHKTDTRRTQLPIDEPVGVYDLLYEYVELQEPATRTQIKRLVDYTQDPAEKAQLTELSGDDEASQARYRREILAKRRSLIDLLEDYPSCSLPFSIYLELLSPLRLRYYSISSSPFAENDRCSITVGVVRGPAKSGHGTFEGVCSTYLSERQVGDVVYAFVQDTKSRFRLPQDASIPLIMIGPGTGLAPFRGFLQERAALKAQGKEVGTSLLYFGCHHPEQDFIYEDELQGFVDQGVTELSVAFSRLDGKKTYVQDKIKEDQEKVWQLLQQGAIIYICGDASRMAPDVRKAFAAIYQAKMGTSEQEANQWLDELTAQNRYLVDVWGITSHP
ncbi:MAG TPA: cytochrome P450 [Ktedonobacteraceae bacterium]|nr:cytochrome P450 [Ktedonobacteraceae bacterium]